MGKEALSFSARVQPVGAPAEVCVLTLLWWLCVFLFPNKPLFFGELSGELFWPVDTAGHLHSFLTQVASLCFLLTLLLPASSSHVFIRQISISTSHATDTVLPSGSLSSGGHASPPPGNSLSPTPTPISSCSNCASLNTHFKIWVLSPDLPASLPAWMCSPL